MFSWLYHSLFDPGNLLASMVVGAPLGWFAKSRLSPHLRRIEEIHNHLDPTHPFTLGGENDGTSSSRR